MHIAVINLVAERARWAAILRQFHAVGLEPARFVAVVGADLPPREVQRLYSPELNRSCYHQPLTAGEIGCYASHVAVWRALLASDQAQVAVFEDDVDIDADLPETLQAVARAPGNWDLIKLVGRRGEQPRSRLPLVLGRDLVEYRRVPGLTGAYVVNRRGAEKLLARRLPFGRPVDVDLRHWWECDLRILGVHPYPVHGAPLSRQSTIEGRRRPATVGTRLRKLFLQAHYTLRNWEARPAGTTPPRIPERRLVPRLAQPGSR